jgi:hypothetical protein
MAKPDPGQARVDAKPTASTIHKRFLLAAAGKILT